MKLPNGNRAVVEMRKLRSYCLSQHHARGKHKARIFEAVLGLSAKNAEELRENLLEVIQTEEATETHRDGYGIRYSIDFVVARENKKAEVRSVWIVRTGEDFPRFVTCYVLT